MFDRVQICFSPARQALSGAREPVSLHPRVTCAPSIGSLVVYPLYLGPLTHCLGHDHSNVGGTFWNVGGKLADFGIRSTATFNFYLHILEKKNVLALMKQIIIFHYYILQVLLSIIMVTNASVQISYCKMFTLPIQMCKTQSFCYKYIPKKE